MTDDPELTPEQVTCRTEGCTNANIPLTILAGAVVVCGVCGEEITDRTPA